MTKLNQTQENILDAFGGSVTWKQIKAEYSKKSEGEILEALNQMWREDDNQQLAADIYGELN